MNELGRRGETSIQTLQEDFRPATRDPRFDTTRICTRIALYQTERRFVVLLPF